MKPIALLFVLLSLNLSLANSARILGVFPCPASSHYILGNRLMIELANRGHQVTFISAFERESEVTNLKDVFVRGTENRFGGYKEKFLTTIQQNPIFQMLTFIQITAKETEETFAHPSVQNLLSSDSKFDIIVMETAMSEAHIGFGYHYKVPTVLVSTMGTSPWVNEYVNNVANPAYVPDVIAGFPMKMGFLDRIQNTVYSTINHILMRLYHLPKHNEILHKYFPDAPDLEELMHKHISMVLLNSHSSYGIPNPKMPNMFEIGGFHVEEPKALPKDLKQYLDSARAGFILFSMGSHVKSSSLPKELRKALMATFAKLPYKILWKFEDDQLVGKPDNVKIGKWLPQNDILAHQNIKLFITHGGLLSTTESVYHGVPFVGIPALGDQNANMVNAERLGIGKRIPLNEVTMEKLYDSINEVLNNKTYRDNIRKRASLMRDQPLRPIDTAIFWIEYSLRHGYLEHLKTGAIDLKWYQIMLLDVIATLLLATALILFIPYYLITKLCCGKSKKMKINKKKKN